MTNTGPLKPERCKHCGGAHSIGGAIRHHSDDCPVKLEIAGFEERLRIKGRLTEAAHISLLQRIREFVQKHGRNGSKTGREDYTKIVPLSDIEPLRVALDEYERVLHSL